MQADIVVIGGGIWGLSTAFHLARAQTGKSIVLLERNADLATETTLRAAGQIGQLRSDPLMVKAVRYTLNLYAEFNDIAGHDAHFVRSGSLHLAHCEARMAAFESELSRAKAAGIEAEIASSQLITKIAPTICQSEIVGALHVPGDGYVDAHRCALALAAAAEELGVAIRRGETVAEICPGSNGRHTIVSDKGTYETDSLVVTTGPWAGRVAAMANIELPMFPIRLQQARTVADVNQPSNHPVVRIPDKSCYLRPEKEGYLYGYFDGNPVAYDLMRQSLAFSTDEIAAPTNLIDEARTLLSPTLPILQSLAIDEYRQGLITATPDGAYVVGPAPGLPGIWIATGCGAMGIAGSGAVGRWLANSILTGDPGADLRALAVDRFGSRTADREWVCEESRTTCSNYYALNSATYSLGGVEN